MPSHVRAAALALSGLLGATALAVPALAAPPPCTCENLESLQQEYQNAVYLEKYMRDLAAVLKAEEVRLEGLKLSSNTDPDQNLSITATVGNLAEQYEANNFRPPFWPAKDYTGPSDVKMPYGTCEQKQEDLDAMEAGSVCEAIAEAPLAHEAAHRHLCRDVLGPEAYWNRPLSEFKLEEAEMYKLQAENLKAELRRVLDAATIRLRGQWVHTVEAQRMMKVVYNYQTLSEDIGGASGGDSWTMAGSGETTNSIDQIVLAGMNCSSTGAIKQEFDVAMTTDGLTFGLELATRRVDGDVGIRCPGGMGMSLPTADAANGTIVSAQPLVLGDNALPTGWADTIKALMASGGVSVTGEPEMVLSVTCPAP
jgi:hypothetical protein